MRNIQRIGAARRGHRFLGAATAILLGLLLTVPARSAENLDVYLWQVKAEAPVVGQRMEAVQSRLAAEVRKMVAAGHLAPLRISTGESGGEYWFVSPGTLACSLAVTLAYLPAEDRAAAAAYLKSEITRYPPHGGLLPLREGARRERYSTPPGFPSDTTSPPAYSRLSGLYGLWAYGYYSGDWQTVAGQWDSASEVFQTEGGRARNLQDVQGLIGFARIARTLKKPQAAAAATAAAEGLRRLTDVEAFVRDAARRYNPVQHRRGDDPYTQYKGFWDISPEVGRFLADHAKAAVESVRQTMEWQIPLWYASQSPVPSEWWQNIPARAEDTFNPPRIAGPLFLVRAYVRGEDAATLERYLDIPYCLGDLDYLQQCVALLRAAGTTGWVPLDQ